MLFDDAFVESIRVKPFEGVAQICERTLEAITPEQGWTAAEYKALLEAHALLRAIQESGVLGPDYQMHLPDLTGEMNRDCALVKKRLEELGEWALGHEALRSAEAQGERFKTRWGPSSPTNFQAGTSPEYVLSSTSCGSK